MTDGKNTGAHVRPAMVGYITHVDRRSIRPKIQKPKKKGIRRAVVI